MEGHHLEPLDAALRHVNTSGKVKLRIGVQQQVLRTEYF